MLLGTADEINGKDLIRKRIMMVFKHVILKPSIFSDENKFRFFITPCTVAIFTKYYFPEKKIDLTRSI